MILVMVSMGQFTSSVGEVKMIGTGVVVPWANTITTIISNTVNTVANTVGSIANTVNIGANVSIKLK